MVQTKKGRGILLGIFAALYFLLFLLHYEISLFVENDLVVEIVSYIVYFLIATLTALCAVLFVHYKKMLGRWGYLSFLYLMLTRLAYAVPYCYIYYITEYYSSTDALVLGALMGLFEMVVLYGVYVLIVFLVSRCKKLGDGYALWLALVLPLYEFAMLLYEFISYLIAYQGLLYLDDMPHFMFGIVYCALLFAASYFLPSLLLPLLCKEKAVKESEENQTLE